MRVDPLWGGSRNSRMNRRALLAAAGAALGAACTPSLGAFDAVAPRDGGARKVLNDGAYGPLPRHRLNLFAPEPLDEPAPVLVFIHGGSWASGDKNEYDFAGAAFASRGFVTAIPNYRLVPEVRFPGFLEDCALAVRWVQDNAGAHGGDPTRVVLAGHSAGAYNAVMLALDPRYLSDAGVEAQHIRGVAGIAGPYDFLPFDVPASQNAFGQAPDPASTQPITFAHADAPPLLLLWGEDDETVGPRNIEGLERAMRATGGAVETKRYPSVNHVDILLALSRPFRGQAPVLADVAEFAQRVTR